MKTAEYNIVDVDHYNKEAVLVVGDRRYYFQWDGKEPPSLVDALDFMKKVCIIGSAS